MGKVALDASLPRYKASKRTSVIPVKEAGQLDHLSLCGAGNESFVFAYLAIDSRVHPSLVPSTLKLGELAPTG